MTTTKRWPADVRRKLRSLRKDEWYGRGGFIREMDWCCPVAALARRIDPTHDPVDAMEGAARRIGIPKRIRKEIVDAADCPFSPHRAELEELLGVR